MNKTVTLLFTASDDFDQLHKGNFPRNIPEDRRRLSNYQLNIYDQFLKEGKIKKIFNNYLFSKGDSRDPELAGFGGAILGSLFTIFNLSINFISNCFIGSRVFRRICSKK